MPKKKADIEKEPKVERTKPEKILTDISCFDMLCDGGLNKESVNLIAGGAGCGKTIFAIQFLVDGIKCGENVLYITFEEKREELYRNMLEFGWDLEKHERDGKFVFIEYTPEKVRNMLEEGGGILESLMYKKRITRIAIDSITSFALLFETELAKREAALALFDMTRRWRTTTLLTFQKELGEEDLFSSASSSALEFEVDSIILLYFLRIGGSRRRFIEILKMRGTKHSKSLHEFEITDRGVVISKKPANISSKKR
jgi:circadian clock protein KaiC